MLTAKFVQHRPTIKIEVQGEWTEVDAWVSSFMSTFSNYNARILGGYIMNEDRVIATVQRNRYASTPVS